MDATFAQVLRAHLPHVHDQSLQLIRIHVEDMGVLYALFLYFRKWYGVLILQNVHTTHNLTPSPV